MKRDKKRNLKKGNKKINNKQVVFDFSFVSQSLLDNPNELIQKYIPKIISFDAAQRIKKDSKKKLIINALINHAKLVE